MRSWTILLAFAAILAWLPASALAEDGDVPAPAPAAEELEFAVPEATDEMSVPAAANELDAEAAPALGLETEFPGSEPLTEEPATEDLADASSERGLGTGLDSLDGVADFADGEAAPAELEIVANDSAPNPAVSPASAERRASRIVLGPEGVDTQGRKGRIHTVVTGETLWDISEAYLGTPWVWPSVWQENKGIDNPHLINPGDRIWITDTMMRRISDEEAEQFLAADDEEVDVFAEDLPAAAEEEVVEDLMADASDSEAEVAVPAEADAGMDQLSMGLSGGSDGGNETGETLQLSWREQTSTLRGDTDIEAAAVILQGVGGFRSLLAQGDDFYIALGRGETAVGDEFTIYREARPISDPHTDTLIGYHVVMLGWAEVTQVDEEASIARIVQSFHDMEAGDRLMPRKAPEMEIALRRAPADIRAQIVYLPDYRSDMGMMDYVYLDQGSLHGMEVGMELEVFRPGEKVVDPLRNTKVRLPDAVDAELVVVTTEADASVAVIVNSVAEVNVGDKVRARSQKMASR